MHKGGRKTPLIRQVKCFASNLLACSLFSFGQEGGDLLAAILPNVPCSKYCHGPPGSSTSMMRTSSSMFRMFGVLTIGFGLGETKDRKSDFL